MPKSRAKSVVGVAVAIVAANVLPTGESKHLGSVVEPEALPTDELQHTHGEPGETEATIEAPLAVVSLTASERSAFPASGGRLFRLKQRADV